MAEMMMFGRGQEDARGIDMLEAMVPFAQWASRQEPGVCLRMLAYVSAIGQVLNEQRVVVLAPDVVLPDCWAMEQAATALRDMALAAGFVEAAAVCEKERCAACELIAHVEALYR
ncbi:MAG TPA: hypothetical protein VKV40_18555 [Ktedonobacteraceae bacterium]|nr:hypothetical protein [Ktedonobacteraceae bacterium]